MNDTNDTPATKSKDDDADRQQLARDHKATHSEVVRHSDELVAHQAVKHEPTAEHPVPTPPATPVVSVAEGTMASSGPAKPSTNTAGTIVLQWMTYALWGWLILALIWLASLVFSNALLSATLDEVVPYTIAATLVLLPIVFLTDFFYRKHEPLRKTGAASIVMVIHAVIFALAGIGTLIGAVFIALSMVLGAGSAADNKSQLVGLLAAGLAAILYAAAFVRTLNYFKTMKFANWFAIAMVATSVVLIGFGIAGPFARSFSLRDDARIEASLPDVSEGINDHVRDKKALPDNLSQLGGLDADAKSLLDDNLVKYVKVGEETAATEPDDSPGAMIYPQVVQKNFLYELCVTYKGSDDSSRGGDDYYVNDLYREDEYQNSLTTYGHPEGEVCYKLRTAVTPDFQSMTR